MRSKRFTKKYIHIHIYVVWMKNTPRIARMRKVRWSRIGIPGGSNSLGMEREGQ